MIPLPYLPTPVAVLQLELAAPRRDLPVPAGSRAARILVRAHGSPLGWVTVEQPASRITIEQQDEALRRQLAGPVFREATARALRAGAPAPPLPPISVVVCTRDREALLAECLAALAGLDYPEYEVLVVDNASVRPETARLAAARSVRCVREDRPGLDWARNRGIAEARHGIIAFTDDDVRVDPQWLRAVAAGFVDPETMLVTGLIAPLELETPAQVAFEYAYGGMDKGCTPRRWGPGPLPPGARLSSHHLGAGANMAFRRTVFAQVGTFDTGLDVGTPSHGGGDLDMFFRVIAAGHVARYLPGALVWHRHRREMPALRRQLRDNGRAFGTYLLTRLAARDGVRRGEVVRYAAGTWGSWLVGRVVRRFRRREMLPLWLQAEELLGACASPWAWLSTRASDARLRRAAGLHVGPPAPLSGR